jgi:hypothetical protein
MVQTNVFNVQKMKRTPNEIGRQAEERAALILNGDAVKQSGGGWRIKLDVTDKLKFIYSIKATETIRNTAIRAIANLWREAISGSRGFMGHGNDAKPALIFEFENELLVLCRLEDHALLATGELEPHIIPTKAEGRRRKASKL